MIASVKRNDSSQLRALFENGEDGMSLGEMTLYAGSELNVRYKARVKACYCVQGKGRMAYIRNGRKEVMDLKPGVIFAPQENAPHRLWASQDIKMVSVYVPALSETELLDFDGSEH